MINTLKFHKELTDAGILILGCDSDGVIDFAPEATQEQHALAAQILAAHDPTPEPVTEYIYDLPLRAPDFLVSSPKVKDDPLEALADALAEASKDNKSIALIALSLARYVEDLEQRLKKAKI